jgi:hypothetical protein
MTAEFPMFICYCNAVLCQQKKGAVVLKMGHDVIQLTISDVRTARNIHPRDFSLSDNLQNVYNFTPSCINSF